MKLVCDLTLTGRPLRPRSGLPQPALRTDFVNGAFHPGGFGPAITFQRASVARCHDASGALVQLAVDAPRIEHDPQTGLVRGLLVEGARTNLILQSGGFATGWTATGGSAAASAQAAPIAGETMVRLTENAAAGNHQISATTAGLAAGAHAFSAYVRAAGRSRIGLAFSGATLGNLTLTADLAAGTATILAGSGTARIFNCGGGLWRLGLIFNAAASEAITLRLQLQNAAGAESYTGDGSSGAFVWGAQLEAGDCVTSYIPTAGSAVTRAADSVQLPLGGWWGAAGTGTMMAEFTCPPVGQSAVVAYLNSTTFQNSIAIAKGNAANNAAGTFALGAMYDGTQALSAPLDLGLTQGPHRAAITWGGGTMRAAANAVLGAQVAQRNPVPTKLWLGQRDGGGLPLNGHIRRFAYWPKRMTDAQLLASVS